MASTSPEVKLAAMRRVQDVAIGLFEEHGFDGVSIAEIADAAGVAARSVYRYFGTKEGIVTWNESDDDFMSEIVRLLPEHGLRAAIRAAISGVDVAFTPDQRARAIRQVALIDDTPALRAHMAAAVEDAGRRLGAVVACARGLDPADRTARLDATLAVTALFDATLEWERTGDERPLSAALSEAIDTLESWTGR